MKINDLGVPKKYVKNFFESRKLQTPIEYKVQYNRDSDSGGEISSQELRISTNRTSLKSVGIPLCEQDYLCPICRKELSSPNELRKHASLHRILRKYFHKFLKISKNTKFLAQSRETITIFNHSDILHQCAFCKERNPIENFRSHVQAHFKRGDFACNQCDRVFKKINHLRTHVTAFI